MPDFSVDDIDVSPIDELIHLLIEDGYINSESVLAPGLCVGFECLKIAYRCCYNQYGLLSTKL